ncbi:hypothetical protein [Streptomyces sp. 8N616]|uniref:hypothetical protein n=1 Tax=Streptomyces sp. 8N616 TaxID=3457414 RepID=UPI003FCFFD3E
MAAARARLRSGTVILGGMGALAAALTACGSDPDKRCVDRDSYLYSKGYRVIGSKDCKSGGSVGTSARSGKSRKSRSGDAAWYYGGTEKDGWVDGGSFTKGSGGSGSGSGSGGSSYDDGNSGVSRGGFGSGSGSSGG